MFGPNNCSSSPALLNATIYVYTDAHAKFRSYYKEEDIGLVTAESYSSSVRRNSDRSMSSDSIS